MVLDFMRDHALLTVDLSFDDRYVNLVEQGVDVAVRMGRLADSSLGATYLGNSPGSWSRRPLTWNGAARPSGRSAGRSRGAGLQHRAGRRHLAFRRRRRADPGHSGEERLRSNNLSVLLDAARDGFGIAVLPRYVADEDLRRGAILPLLEDWRLPGQEIHAVYPSPRMVPAKVRELVAWLKGRFRDEWWRADVRGAMSHEQSR